MTRGDLDQIAIHPVAKRCGEQPMRAVTSLHVLLRVARPMQIEQILISYA